MVSGGYWESVMKSGDYGESIMMSGDYGESAMIGQHLEILVGCGLSGMYHDQ